MTEGSTALVEKIEYYRQVRPPSLKQFVWRQAVKEANEAAKGATGVMINPRTGMPAPKAAVVVQEELRNKTVDDLIKERPEWEQEWRNRYG